MDEYKVHTKIKEALAAIESYQVLDIEYINVLNPALYLLSVQLDNGEQVIQKFIKI